MKHFVFLLFAYIPVCALAQLTPSYKHEVDFAIDNDVFLFIDRYYSAGHHLSYRTILNSNHSPHLRTANAYLLSVQLDNEIFTSRKIRYAHPMNMDRPYAGYYSGAVSINHLRGSSSAQALDVEVGMVGEQTGISQLHTWWHEKTGFQEPRGWRLQIANEIVFNASYQYRQAFALAPQLDLVSTSSLHVGTGLNKLSQELTFRFARFRPLNQSVFTNSALNDQGNHHSAEAFFFAGGGVDYVVSNIFLEGSLFSDNPSPFTVDAVTWVFRSRLGFMYSKNQNSFQVIANVLSREMQRGITHCYLRLALARRF